MDTRSAAAYLLTKYKLKSRQIKKILNCSDSTVSRAKMDIVKGIKSKRGDWPTTEYNKPWPRVEAGVAGLVKSMNIIRRGE